MSGERCLRTDFEKAIASQLQDIGGRLLVAVSGGADSVALLRALHALGRDIEAVTCNFHLRGEESDRDCRSVVELCRRLGIDLTVMDFDAAAYAAERKVSIEMACRDLRYAEFRRLKMEHGCSRIAVAHNADDNIETLLLNLVRSTGIEGLKGMSPDTGEIVRPMLSITRRDIERYLEELGQDYVTDSTNADESYNRNYLRHTVIPALERRWPAVRQTIAKTLRILRSEAAALDAAVRTEGDMLSFERVRRLGETALFRFAYACGARPLQVEEMWRHAKAPVTGKRWETSSGTIYSDREGFVFVSRDDAAQLSPYRWTYRQMSTDLMEEIRHTAPSDGVWLPHDGSRYCLRLPQPGDRIEPLGMRGSRAVSDIIKESRLSYDKRVKIRVLESTETGRIIWVEGLRRSRHDLVSPDAHGAWLMAPEP